MFDKLLCWFGWHTWRYSHQPNRNMLVAYYRCAHCKRLAWRDYQYGDMVYIKE